jgi:general secretion pathway protein A
MPSISPPSDQLSATESFFGFSARPFSLTPDLRFAYQSRSHSKALEQVTEALQRREGLVVITGEIGTGKTMLCRALLGTFEPRTFLSVILDPCLSVDDLLHRVLVDFGLMAESSRPNAAAATDATRHQLVTTLQRFLASLIPLGAHAVIMIDEAQHLSPTVLEEIRLLSNFETEDAKLLQIVLVGQPDLDHVLRRPDMQQLAQRIARRVELHALSDGEVQDYIERRLIVATEPPPRRKGEPPRELARAPADADVTRFTPAAIRTVTDVSHGVPRVINTLCDRALEVAFEQQTRSIDRSAVVGAAERLKLPVPAPPSQPDRTRPLAVAAAILAIVAAALWWYTRPVPPASSLAAAPVTAAPQPTPPPVTPPATPPPAPVAAAEPSSVPPRETPPAPRAPAPAASAATAGSVSSPSGGAGRYNIAVAAFRTAGRAADVAAGLTKAGINVSIRTDSTGGWHQIVAGPYRSPEEAAVAQRVLAREGFTGTRVSFSPPEG